MSKTRKIWLGIFTFLPILFFIGYFILFFLFFFNTIGDFQALESMENNPTGFPTGFMVNFAMMFIFIMVASLSSLALMVYYIIHAHNNVANDSNKKLMWTLVIIFTSSVGSIVYYFVEILPLKNQEL